MRHILLVLLAAAALATGAEEPPAGPAWVLHDTGSAASLRGLSAVSAKVVWASGSGGTVLRTVDGGRTWSTLPVPGAGELELRDVEAWGETTAVLSTAGQPARIYRTEDGGKTFELVHESPHEAAFFDAMAFWDTERGLLYSDPVDGRFLVLTTGDGGRSWSRVAPAALPKPVAGEAGFAASGTNVAVGPGGLAWIGTGGAVARVLSSADYGRSWSVAPSPLRQGAQTAGIFSIAFRDARHGLVVGGDYSEPENPAGNVARSSDGGRSWQPVAGPPPAGHRACVVYLPQRNAWLAVGRAGTDLSTDDGRSWTRLSEEGFYTAGVAADGSVWAAGAGGRVARLEWGR